MRRTARICGRKRISVLSCAWALLAWTAVSSARTEETTGYTKSQAYNGALRFLRVEQEFQVIEKDADLGYMLFEYPTGTDDDTTTGSVEVIERDEEVLVVVQISELPAHHESRLASALLKKLEADYGALPQKRAKEKAPPEADPPAKDDAEPDDPADEPSKSAPRNQRKK